jgi:hypothetical protein
MGVQFKFPPTGGCERSLTCKKLHQCNALHSTPPPVENENHFHPVGCEGECSLLHHAPEVENDSHSLLPCSVSYRCGSNGTR